MPLRFAANVNFLFAESASSIAERIRLAYQHGFRAVEISSPRKDACEILKVIQDTGVAVSLVNIAVDECSDQLKFGATSVPGAEQLFLKQLNESIEFANVVKCKKLHLMAGLTGGGSKKIWEHRKTYSLNLRLASEHLKCHSLIGLIEPINKYTVPFYFLNSYAQASEIIREIKCDNIKLLVDIYHLQHICGNVTRSLQEYKNLIGHFQIAQVPGRNEPDTPGELNYGYVFDRLKSFSSDCRDWIGCEYKPKGTTAEGTRWLAKYGFKL